MRFRTAYDPDYHPDDYATDLGDEPGLTKQSFKDECDINGIVNRFQATGLVTHLAKGQPEYLDVSEVGDYREALNQVRAVGEFFRGLPSDLRADFNNDPAEFLDFASDPANAERMAEYGLLDSGDRRDPPGEPDSGASNAPSPEPPTPAETKE